jgi:hypothetical protein
MYLEFSWVIAEYLEINAYASFKSEYRGNTRGTFPFVFIWLHLKREVQWRHYMAS